MRILVLSDLYPPVAFGGYELECAALVERLRLRHDVLVLTSDHERDSAPADPGVRRTLPFIGGDRRRAVAVAPLAARRGAGEARRVLAGFAPDLIYVSNGVSIPQAAIAVAGDAGAPVICRFSELFYAGSFLRGDRFLRHLEPGERGVRGAWARAMRTVNRRPPLCLQAPLRIRAAISWASASLREEAGVPPTVDLVLERVIHPGTSHAATFGAVGRRAADRPTIVYVGRVTVAKGAEVALRALAEVRARHRLGARLVFAGTALPDVRRRLDALAAELGVAEHVTLLGHLTPDAVADLLATAGVALMPSLEHEAFGLVALEAALAGVPVVASTAGGIGEGLRHEEHALLFAPGDAAACADAVARILSRPGEAEERVARARERAGHFTLGTYLDRSEELIADVT